MPYVRIQPKFPRELATRELVTSTCKPTMEISAVFEKNSLHFRVQRSMATIEWARRQTYPENHWNREVYQGIVGGSRGRGEAGVAPITVASSYAASESPAACPPPGSVCSSPASTSQVDRHQTGQVHGLLGMDAEKPRKTSSGTVSAAPWGCSGWQVLEEKGRKDGYQETRVV